jgi:regulator of protease activity HflC (stomatin/prohibitin superfamily)
VTEILIAAVVLIALIVVASVIRSRFERVTVFEYERGLRYDKGHFTGTVGPGRYWLVRDRSTIEKLDTRPTVVTVPGQEVITSDGVSIRVSLALEYAIADPAIAVNEHGSFASALYVAAQVALRELASKTEVDALLERRGELGAELRERTDETARGLGLELRSIELKDLMFPGELRRTFAQVVAARKEGLAALERARGETAALRNLANAARVMAGNPALMHLRLIQELGKTPGNTIVLGLPSSTTPLPLRDASAPPDVGEPPELPPSPE